MLPNRLGSALLATAIFSLVFFTFSTNVFAQTVVLDSGHDPEINGNFLKSGVIGTCGQAEYIYNDQVTEVLKKSLDPHFKVVLTRESGKAVDFSRLTRMPVPSAKRTLYARPAIANAVGCSAFVAIHHDSTSANNKMTEPNLCTDENGSQKPGLKLKPEFMSRYKVGYNVFVTQSKRLTLHEKESLRLATVIARRIKEMGRTPSDYHAKVRDCPTCRDIIPELGVMHQGLAVLRLAKCPAILIEVGNVIDPADEKLVRSAEFRSKFAEQIKLGLEDFFAQKK